MPEFMASMDITFPESMSLRFRDKILAEEAGAAAAFLDSGQMVRVWRTYGPHSGNHGHLALWDAPDKESVSMAYSQFPLVQMGYGIVSDITELEIP